MKRGENGYRRGKNPLKMENRQYTTDKNPD